MKSNSEANPQIPKILFLLISLSVLFACSTEEMEFSVSDQVLNGGTSQGQASDSQGPEIDESAEEVEEPQDVIPEVPAQETAQPIPEENKNKADAELNCAELTPPNISYWPYRSPLGDAQNLLLADARLGAHSEFDRFVLEFEPNPTSAIGGPPDSYSIQWASQPPIQFGSGQEIEIAGTEYLEILLHGYAYSRGTVPSEYAGPTEVQARGTTNVIEAVFGGEVEGKMVWAIGVNNQTGFRVLEISDPPRLVIDICTSANG